MSDSENDLWAAASDDDGGDSLDWSISSAANITAPDGGSSQTSNATVLAQLSNYPSPPLDVAAQEIRLLQILPAHHPHEVLRSHLGIHSLKANPEYEALSYTWGTSSLEQTTKINGKDVPVTDNLAVALLRLRRSDRTRTIWVDALCINQENAVERAYQVTLMAQIYAMASSVVVWLGDSRDPWATNESASRNVAYQSYDELLAEDHKRRSLVNAISNTIPRWWERVWILQEVVVGASDPTFCFGPYTVTWSQLEYMLNTNNKTSAGTGLVRSLEFLRRLKEAYIAGDIDLLETLGFIEVSKATDFRDKIFGLLGFQSAIVRRSIRPDYTAPCAQVFNHALMAYAIEKQSFMVLAAFYPAEREFRFSDSFCSVPITVPPWVSALWPNPKGQLASFQHSKTWQFWELQSGPIRSMAQKFWNPSVQQTTVYDKTLELRCSGLLFDRVRAVSRLGYQGLSTYLEQRRDSNYGTGWIEILAQMLQWEMLMLLAIFCYFLNLLIPLQIVRRLKPCIMEVGCGLVRIGNCEPKIRAMDSARYVFLSSLLSFPGKSFPAAGASLDYGNHRTMFCTHAGVVGTAPERIHLGDAVVLVDNTFIPAILTPYGDHYQFVCYCYLPAMQRAGRDLFIPMDFYIR